MGNNKKRSTVSKDTNSDDVHYEDNSKKVKLDVLNICDLYPYILK